jgi:hypothetical protein
VPEYTPRDDVFVLPNGFRRMREPTVRRKADVAEVTEILSECTFQELPKEEVTGPPIDYGSWRIYSELGMMGITDFPHYHFNPEADEMSACSSAFLPTLSKSVTVLAVVGCVCNACCEFAM